MKYCDERVCVIGVFVSLSDSISLELHVQLSPDYLHVTYGHGSVHLRRRCDSLFTYLVPVLWMTSYLHIMAKNRRCDISVYSNWLNRGQHGFVSAAHSENDASGAPLAGGGVWYLRLLCCSFRSAKRRDRLVAWAWWFISSLVVSCLQRLWIVTGKYTAAPLPVIMDVCSVRCRTTIIKFCLSFVLLLLTF